MKKLGFVSLFAFVTIVSACGDNSGTGPESNPCANVPDGRLVDGGQICKCGQPYSAADYAAYKDYACANGGGNETAPVNACGLGGSCSISGTTCVDDAGHELQCCANGKWTPTSMTCPAKPADSGTDSGADSAPMDTGTVDTGTSDSGAADTGALDTGATDSGAVDTGTVDSSADADAGPPTNTVKACGVTGDSISTIALTSVSGGVSIFSCGQSTSPAGLTCLTCTTNAFTSAIMFADYKFSKPTAIPGLSSTDLRTEMWSCFAVTTPSDFHNYGTFDVTCPSGKAATANVTNGSWGCNIKVTCP